MQVSSTGNLLTVRFKSDAYVSGRGFNASWTEVQGGTRAADCTTSVFTTQCDSCKRLWFFPLTGCGGPVVAHSGEIHSPSYPNNYPHNVDCSWVISVDPSHRVFLNFSDLDIELHTSCNYDYVAVSFRPQSYFFYITDQHSGS